MDEAPPPGVVEHPATPEKLQEEQEEAAENDENEAEPQNETAGWSYSFHTPKKYKKVLKVLILIIDRN